MCHQTVSLTARALEAGGIATVVIGNALDIVTTCGVPRYLHSELPLGNPMGIPFDQAMQQQTLEQSLALLESATEPGSISTTTHRFATDDQWKMNYARVDDANRKALLQMGDENRKRRKLNHLTGMVRK